jgi:transcriptional regulator with XRE-family HTH domain
VWHLRDGKELGIFTVGDADDVFRGVYSKPQRRLARFHGAGHTHRKLLSLTHMIEISLGQRLHELRDRADLSLRELAKKVGISGPFLSDIELGRRFPSEEILAKLARALNVPLEELKKYDNREPIADLKRLMDSDPKLGFAFRTAVEKVKSGELTAEDIIARLSKSSKPPRKK